MIIRPRIKNGRRQAINLLSRFFVLFEHTENALKILPGSNVYYREYIMFIYIYNVNIAA